MTKLRNANPFAVGTVALLIALGAYVDADERSSAAPGENKREPRKDSFLGGQAGDAREVDGIRFCWCPPGRFRMGSPPDEPERRPDEAQVEVTLTKGFWMGKYEVTQGQWKRMVGKLPGELTVAGGEGDDLPVYNVNYSEAEAFCLKSTELGRQSGDLPMGWEFRLPTEAQWEYACRAGTRTATSFGDKLSSRQANFQGTPYNGAEKGPSLNRATRVGSYAANLWGLHDMHGNVYEWCRDWSHQKLPGGDDPDLSSKKGTMNRDGTFSRVRRGGAWCDDGQPCRSARRLRFEPERRYDHIGFRVAIVPQLLPPGTIAERLKKKISVIFQREPLYKAVEFVARETGVQINMDGTGMKMAGVTQNVIQTFSLEDVPATAVLHKMLKSHQLVLVVDEDKKIATVTSARAADRNQQLAFPLDPDAQE